MKVNKKLFIWLGVGLVVVFAIVMGSEAWPAGLMR